MIVTSSHLLDHCLMQSVLTITNLANRPDEDDLNELMVAYQILQRIDANYLNAQKRVQWSRYVAVSFGRLVIDLAGDVLATAFQTAGGSFDREKPEESSHVKITFQSLTELKAYITNGRTEDDFFTLSDELRVELETTTRPALTLDIPTGPERIVNADYLLEIFDSIVRDGKPKTEETQPEKGDSLHVDVDPFAIMHDEMKAKGALDREIGRQFVETRAPRTRKELISKHGSEAEAFRYYTKECDNLRQRRTRAVKS